MNVTSIDRIWNEGFNKIMGDASANKEQVLWVTEASENIRKIPSEELLKRGFLYVPNDIYMLHYFGAEIAEYKYGVYKADQCSFYKRLVFPIRGFDGEVAGLGGWANDSQWKYVYSPDTCWDKRKYFYISPEDFVSALDYDYLIIVDGIFDAINLNRLGLHAASLMGSNFSYWHKLYLKLFKYLVVIPDNDNAGLHLTQMIRKYRKDAIVIQQGKFGDIDDYIRSCDTKKLIDKFQNMELMSVLHNVQI